MSQLAANLLLLLVTVIWGTTFILVKTAIQMIKPFTFLAARFFIGSLFILLWLAIRQSKSSWDRSVTFVTPAYTLKGGVLTGAALFFSYVTQTFGLLTVSAGKAAFITGLSVVLVPLASALIFKEIPDKNAFIGVTLAAIGLALMSLVFPFNIEIGDILVFLCAVGFASHIILVGMYSRHSDPVIFTLIQLMIVAAGSFIAAICLEWPLSIPIHTSGALIYSAVVATSITVLIQSAVQKYTSATNTALIFSTEPVFAALFAWISVGEILKPREMLGAGLILLGMLISEIGPWKRRSFLKNEL